MLLHNRQFKSDSNIHVMLIGGAIFMLLTAIAMNYKTNKLVIGKKL